MKLREVHYYLLSLFIRSLGVWLLYLSSNNLYSIVDDVYHFFVPMEHSQPDWWDLYFFASRVGIAAYFILGAPPFLSWATRDKDRPSQD